MTTFREIKMKMRAEGWKFKKFYCYKKIGKFQIDIEFCIGGFCVALYDKDLNLIKPKKHHEDFVLALINAAILELEIYPLTKNHEKNT